MFPDAICGNLSSGFKIKQFTKVTVSTMKEYASGSDTVSLPHAHSVNYLLKSRLIIMSKKAQSSAPTIQGSHFSQSRVRYIS
jgi:hypothetical protein